MKNALRIILLFVVLTLVFVLVATLFFPKTYSIKRERRIPAPIDSVFKYATDYKLWDEWSPWKEMDPEATYKFSDQTNGIGAWMEWNGEQIGEGKMTTTNLIVNQEWKYELNLTTPKSASHGGMFFEGNENETRVQWYDMGEAKWPMGRIMGVMMDNMMGPVFEDGLRKLDSVVMHHKTQM